MQRTILNSVWYTPPMPGATILDGPPPQCIGVVAIASGPEKYSWKAYIGFGFGDNEQIDAQLIARNGVKITKEVACAHFPELSPDNFIF